MYSIVIVTVTLRHCVPQILLGGTAPIVRNSEHTLYFRLEAAELRDATAGNQARILNPCEARGATTQL